MKEGAEWITIVEFVAFDKKQVQRTFINATPEQCSQFIWKNVWETAVIKNITEYKIESQKTIYGFQKTQNVTNHAKSNNGSSVKD